MTARSAAPLAAPLAAALVLVAGGAWAQTPFPDDPDATAAIPAAPAPAPKRTSTGMCSILRGDQVLEQQNCKALADAAEPPAGSGFAKGITYVWPSGNRTIVGGSEEDFAVNGNLAVPLPDSGHGLCLKVEKTGNTFCYKEGARVKTAAAQPAAGAPAAGAPAAGVPAATAAAPAASAGSAAAAPPPTAAASKTAEAKATEAKPAEAKAPEPKATEPKPVESKPAPTAATVTAAAAAPAAASASPSLATKLAEEVKLRQAAEDELKLLKSEIARLNEIEEKRIAELAEQRRKAEAEDKKKVEDAAQQVEAEKTRVAALARDREAFESRCTEGDAVACEAAIALVKGTSATADPEVLTELELMLETARNPTGVTALAAVPPSTWAMGALSAVLALAVIALSLRRREKPDDLDFETDSLAEMPPPMPSLDAAHEPANEAVAGLGPAPSPGLSLSAGPPPPLPGGAPSLGTSTAAPSLDPFAALPRPSDPFPPPLLSLETASSSARPAPAPLPPPLPKLSTMDSLYPPKS